MPNQAIPLTITQWKFTTDHTDPAKLVNKRLEQIVNGKFILAQPANQTYTTDADGCITLSTRGLQPGAAMIRYQAPGDNFNVNQGSPTSEGPGTAPRNFYFGLVSYNIFRVLPDDNFDDIPVEQITWDLVYKNVIRYFYLIYPRDVCASGLSERRCRAAERFKYQAINRQKHLEQYVLHAGFTRPV